MQSNNPFSLIGTTLAAVLVFLSLPSMVLAQNSTMDISIDKDDVAIGNKEYSPYLNRRYPQRAFWGDTHLRLVRLVWPEG